MKIKERRALAPGEEIALEDLPALAVKRGSYWTDGTIEIHEQNLRTLEVIVGRLLARVATSDQDALELAGLQHSYTVAP